MGRLILNVPSFAQFEGRSSGTHPRQGRRREAQGQFTGGTPPLGYDVDPEKTRLVVNPEEAKLVRHIFKRFTEIGSLLTIADELNKKDHHQGMKPRKACSEKAIPGTRCISTGRYITGHTSAK